MVKNKFITIIFLLLLFLQCVSAEVEIKGFVNDYANIINDADEQQLNQVLENLYNSGEAEYSIVTVDNLEGKDIESYSLNLAQGNLGDTEKNNGLLLLVALEERKYWFQVGRGLEYILNDAKVGRIGRYYLVPNFQEGNYGNGILEASLSVNSIILGENASKYYVTGNEGYNEERIGDAIYAFFLLLFIASNILVVFVRKRKFKNRYFNAAATAVILFGGRGRHGGGGFGGFGGGSFGGGGAGGSW